MQRLIHLDDWQEDVLNTKGNILLCTGRQVGKTTIMAMKACKLALRKVSRILVVSLTEDQAKLIIEMCLNYLEQHSKGQIRTGRQKPTQNIIRLKNGSWIRARPVGNTGAAVRGFTGDVLIVDEASRMPEMMWAAAKPTLLTTGGELWLCSTPHGKHGYFYECYQNKHKRFKIFHISSEKVIQDRPISSGWTEHQRAEAIKFLEEEKKDMSELRYGQEYLGKFLDELRQFFPDELIERVCKAKRPSQINSQDIFLMGCDLARLGGDETTMEIVKKTKDTVIQVENITKKNLYTNQSEDLIKQLNEKWKLNKIGLDAGSGTLGVSIFDHLFQDREIRRKLVAMNNRRVSIDKDGKKTQRIFKEDMYDNLLGMMERGDIQLLDDGELIVSLKSVQWEIIRTQMSETKIRIFGNYTHIVEGLVRAAWLAKEKNLNLWISYI